MNDNVNPHNLSTTADLLMMEFEEWFRNLMKNHVIAPRAFTGVTRNDQQFVLILNDIPWTRPSHIQRRAFIHWLCRKEGIVAYAYASMMGLEDGGREISIVADDDTNFVSASLPIVTLTNGNASYGATTVHRWKVGDHWHPYVGLMKPGSVSEADSVSSDEDFFGNVWGEIRPKAFWRERNDKGVGVN